MDKILNLMGLAMKAGAAKSGSLSVEEAVKSGKAHLLVMAEDASEGTKKQLTNMAGYRAVDLLSYGTKESLGRALGKEERSAVAITEAGFAKSIKEQILSVNTDKDAPKTKDSVYGGANEN